MKHQPKSASILKGFDGYLVETAPCPLGFFWVQAFCFVSLFTQRWKVASAVWNNISAGKKI